MSHFQVTIMPASSKRTTLATKPKAKTKKVTGKKWTQEEKSVHNKKKATRKQKAETSEDEASFEET
jgi:hypothetical protein